MHGPVSSVATERKKLLEKPPIYLCRAALPAQRLVPIGVLYLNINYIKVFILI